MTTPCSTITAPARFLLLGDSHAACIGQAAEAAGLPFAGGPIGSGRDFLGPFFDIEGPQITFRSPQGQSLYRDFLDGLGTEGLAGLQVPVVCTFGFSVHTLATRQNWDIHRDHRGDVPDPFLSGALFGDLVRAMVRGALAFYDHTTALGLRVLAVMPPQRVPGMSDARVFHAAQDTVRDEVAARGVEIVDLRARVTDGSGVQRPVFCLPDDSIHGNLAFGRLVVAELLDRGV